MEGSGGAGEKIVATILHTAYGPGFQIHHLFLTGLRLLSVPGEAMSKLEKGAYAAAYLAIRADYVVAAGMLLGLRAWKKTKPEGPLLLRQEADLDPRLVSEAAESIPYEEIKSAKVWKPLGDPWAQIRVKGPGLMGTRWWNVIAPLEEVRAFVRETPLGPKLR